MPGAGANHAGLFAAANEPASIATDKIVCPCCPLHCDDLTGIELASSTQHCSLAYARLNAPLEDELRSSTSGEDHELLRRCAAAVRTSAQTIITGRVLDLATSRAVMKFSDQVGAEIRLTGPNHAAQAAMKRDGSYTCTLGELTQTNRSLLIIGDAEQAWPRISRHLNKTQELAYLDDSPALLDQLAALRLSIASESMPVLSAELLQPGLRQSLELVRRASYLVVLVAPLREDLVRSPLIWSSILGLIQDINRSRRAAMLTFDETYTLRSTMASRMDRVAQGISTIEPTLQIHLSPFGETCTVESPSILYIGRAVTGATHHLLLPAAIPGIDSPGIAYRGDGSVALPLVAWKGGLQCPSPAERLKQLLEWI